MKFYLGCDRDRGYWLYRSPVPLFVSRRTLARQKTWKKANCDWALDSGGFSELSQYGRWQTSPEQYIDEVQRWSEQLGRLQWSAVQDWMCEPAMLAKTGMSIYEHQARTIDSWELLTSRTPALPWVPVLQGYHPRDYWSHLEQYDRRGHDLTRLSLVGLGSVCRRQHSEEIEGLTEELSAVGIRLHGFGVKADGLSRYAKYLASADSLAWSYAGRIRPDNTHSHKTCAHCFPYALEWRRGVVLPAIASGLSDRQSLLFGGDR